jgi:hypothetical protein
VTPLLLVAVTSFYGVPGASAEPLSSEKPPSSQIGEATDLVIAPTDHDLFEDFIEANAEKFGGVTFYSGPKVDSVALVRVVGEGAEFQAGRNAVAEWLKGRPAGKADPEFAGYRLRFANAVRPLASLLEARKELHASALMKDHVSDWIDPEMGRLVVQVLSSESMARTKAASFGDLTTVSVTPNGRGARLSSRIADSEPYSGAIRITPQPGYTWCTAGFTVMGTAIQQLTAGHCGETYFPFYNNGVWIGEVKAYKFDQNGYDAARYALKSYQGRVYIGGALGAGTQTMPIHSWIASAVGDAPCWGGSQSGQICTEVTVTVPDTCHTFGDGITTCHLVRADGLNPVITWGDSGGPIYRYRTATTLYAMGTIVGATQVGSTWQHFYHPVSRLLTLWGLTLVTSY